MLGSELNCTPGKGVGGAGGTKFFLNFSPALYYLNAWNWLALSLLG